MVIANIAKGRLCLGNRLTGTVHCGEIGLGENPLVLSCGQKARGDSKVAHSDADGRFRGSLSPWKYAVTAEFPTGYKTSV
jgi:hypothetical protein